MASYFIGVDVGTGSARAGVFDLNGRMVGQASRAIEIYRPQADFVEQSSDNIWQAVCNAVRDAINQSDINPIGLKVSALTRPVHWWCWTKKVNR